MFTNNDSLVISPKKKGGGLEIFLRLMIMIHFSKRYYSVARLKKMSLVLDFRIRM